MTAPDAPRLPDDLVIPPRPPLPAPAAQRHARNAAPQTLLRDPRTSLIAYIVALALIAFWPTHVDEGAGPLLRTITRLVPFLTYPRIEFGANVMLFVPLGLLLTLILTRHRWLVLPIAFVATVTIEAMQAAVLDARTPSILDIIANTAGACLGMIIAAVAEELTRKR